MTGLDVAISCKRYREPATVALEDVRFSAASGDFVALVGPSGAGKSTLLNIVAGIDTQVEGEIRLNGATDAAAGASTTLPALAFVFQSPRLMPWLSALENVELVLGRTPDGAQVARHWLEEVELAEFADAYPGQLSGGMQRRVALARAFAVQPGLLLMDEPFVSLDEPTAHRLRALLMRLWKKIRPTVLYVTHDLREALTLADRVLFFSSRPGRVVLDVPIELHRPRAPASVEALYTGLLDQHPALLSGLVASPEEQSAGPAKGAA